MFRTLIVQNNNNSYKGIAIFQKARWRESFVKEGDFKEVSSYLRDSESFYDNPFVGQ